MNLHYSHRNLQISRAQGLISSLISCKPAMEGNYTMMSLHYTCE